MKNRSKMILFLTAIFAAIALSACASTGGGDAAQSTTEAKSEKLTQAQAETIALEHAGFSAEQVTDLRTEKDWDDGRMEYDIDFRQGDYEFDYTIHAETGKILDWDKKYDPKPTAPAQTESKPVLSPAGRLTREEAVDIALNHAGLTADQITGLEVSYDMDDGIPTYEVDFDSGRWEYSYQIQAETGEILSWEKDDR